MKTLVWEEGWNRIEEKVRQKLLRMDLVNEEETKTLRGSENLNRKEVQGISSVHLSF